MLAVPLGKCILERGKHFMEMKSEGKKCDKQSCDTMVKEGGGTEVLQVQEQRLCSLWRTTVEQIDIS